MKTRLISILFVIAVIMSAFVFSASAASGNCSLIYESNKDSYDYTTYWADTVKSYLTDTGSGYMRVQSVDNTVYAEYYSYDFALQSSKKISAELPIFGAFYETGSNYYLLTGQNNINDDSSVEVYRITKYDKNWKRLGSCSLYGANTYMPFAGGSARMEASGNYLLIHTCHEMYDSGGGIHHQANVTIEVNTSSMKVTDSYYSMTNISFGYVSHSFNQFLHIEDGKLYTVDQGDSYPRSVVLCEYTGSITDGSFISDLGWDNTVNNYSFLDIEGTKGVNYTGVEVGGFEISSSNFICVGNSRDMDSGESIRNIFVSTINKSTKKTTLTYLTSYAQGTEFPSTPYLVKISTDSYMVIWTRAGKVNYVTIDGTGKKTSAIKSFTGSISDCKPIVKGSKVIWYVSDDDGNVTFYKIDASSLGHSSKTIAIGHKWAATSTEGTFKCSNCGTTIKGYVPTSVFVGWVVSSTATSTSYDTILDEDMHPGDSHTWLVRMYGGDDALSKYTVTTNNSDVISLSGNSFSVVGTGTANITFHFTFNSKLDRTYTIISSHSASSYTTTKAATCTATGTKKATCTVCGKTFTETIPATGHKVVKLAARTATVYKYGVTAGTKCSVCGKVLIAQTKTLAQGTGLKASSVKTTSLTLKWTAINGAKYYKLQQYNSSTKKWVTLTTTTAKSYAVSGLTAGKTHKFRVTPFDSTKKIKGATSATFAVSTLCKAPTIKLASNYSNSATVTISKVTGAKSYIVYFSTDNKTWYRYAMTTSTTYNLNFLTAGKKVYVKVAANNADSKESAYSAVKSVTVKK